MKPAPLIDSTFLEKLERLAIQWQKSFPGLVGGHNISHFSGPGQEFLDHRQFHHGDDLRAVNWRAYLRLEKLFLKMFQVEPRIPVRVLLDCSNSMTTGSVSKFDYARKLAAALCYVGLVRLDTIAIQPFGNGLSDSFLCGGGRHRFIPAVNFLQDLKAGGRTNFFEVARQFITKYPQRGLLIIISDFLDDRECERPLQYLADFGHELMLLHVWDQEDRDPPWEGQLDLTDAESGATIEIGFDASARRSYMQAFDDFARNIQRIGLRNSGRYVGLSTSTAIEDAIFGSIARTGGIQ
ncbi:MAG TPA: DUF58 domain-containing protein [Bryobacteraceae bacterium]|nr:DUF58 domain-containing protein [Bryobacteraceae bacterium]